MFRRSVLRSVSAVLIPFLLALTFLPTFAAAQGESSAEACMQGKADAQRNVSGMWFFAGCLGLVGVLIAYLVAPQPPAASLLGKSPEAALIYTDCYQTAAKSKQGSKAVVGCFVAGAVEALVYVILVAVVVSSDNSSSW